MIINRFIIFVLFSLVFYFLIFSLSDCVSNSLKKAIRVRLPKKVTSVTIIKRKVSKLILKHFDFDDGEMEILKNDLDSLNISTPPKVFLSEVYAESIVYAFLSIPIMILSPIFIGVVLYIGYYTYNKQMKKVKNEIERKRTRIELELPQFAGTIRQSLNSTRNVESILKSYSKICGESLKGEILRTINDIKLTNTESALRMLANRVGSEKFSKIIRGLISVSNGEDQRVYFEILTEEFVKIGNAIIRKELQKRPERIKGYTTALLGCLMLSALLPMILFAISQGKTII